MTDLVLIFSGELSSSEVIVADGFSDPLNIRGKRAILGEWRNKGAYLFIS